MGGSESRQLCFPDMGTHGHSPALVGLVQVCGPGAPLHLSSLPLVSEDTLRPALLALGGDGPPRQSAGQLALFATDAGGDAGSPLGSGAGERR